MHCSPIPLLLTEDDQLEVRGDSRVKDQKGVPQSTMLIHRSVFTGHSRPLLCGRVEHDMAEVVKTGVVLKEEEPIAGPPEPDLVNARQLLQEGKRSVDGRRGSPKQIDERDVGFPRTGWEKPL